MIFNKMRVSPFLLQTNTFPKNQAEKFLRLGTSFINKKKYIL